MSTAHTIQTALEILIASALIVGLFNESRLAKFERKMLSKFKRK